MTTSPMLKPCPFCGSDEVRLVDDTSCGGCAYGSCDHCGAEGAPTDTTDDARTAWNARPDTPARPDREAVARIEKRIAEIKDHVAKYPSNAGNSTDQHADDLLALLALLPPPAEVGSAA